MKTIENLKDLLIAFADTEGPPGAALSYGLSLAGRAGAHVTIEAASVRVPGVSSPMSSLGADMVATENKRTRELAQTFVENARREAAAVGVPCTAEVVQMDQPDMLATLARRSRMHDLTILGAAPNAFRVLRRVFDAVLFDSGRPVLVAPPQRESFSVERIVVAWDGSARAARAVNDAMPLLRAAGAVEILSVTGEKDLSRAVPGAEIAPHLARHGVEAAVVTLPALNADVAGTIRAHAGNTRADLIVMGAYAHSRLFEMVLGGVTRSLLEDCRTPLLLSH